jgi:ABC-type lipoprotein release transport system permease subunit
MSEAAEARVAPTRAPLGPGLVGSIAWRNLWRNRLRTALITGGIAFAVLLIVAAYSLQGGTMGAMADNATHLLSGHAQIQNPAYADDPALRNLVPDATAVARSLAKVAGITTVAPRAIGFALVSVGERSFGAQIMGVDPQAEPSVSMLPNSLVEGHYIQSPTDAVVGAAMARNLGIKVGDGFVVLGSKLDGGVAALSLDVAGIVETGSADLDRGLVQMQLAAFQEEFGLGDQVHMVVARVGDFDRVGALVPAIEAAIAPLGTDSVVLPWQELMPEVSQAIQLKRAGSLVMLALVSVLVTFSIFNSFMMTVFERTREFGMLLAIGMRPAGIISVLLIEAAWLALLGAGLGLVLAVAVMSLTQQVGIPIGEMAGELARRMHIPDRIYPALNVDAMLLAPLLMLLATQFAALIPALRIRRLVPVDALRVGA